MTATVVLGLAWGDEGKGRVCDALASDVRYVARYSGGNNAGHTIRIGQEEFVVHLIPSGIVREGVVCTVGNGVVVNPEVLEQEVTALEKRGLSVRDRLKIDGRSHLILPYHILLDSHREKALGDAKIGTTNRGIGPTYEDKVARVGIRVQDLFDEGILRAKLEAALREKNSILENVYGEEPYEAGDLADYLLSYRVLLGPMMADTGALLREALEVGESVLLEGAQATLLDNDHGTYPFVTSSNPSVGGAVVGSGIPPRALDRVIGVTKAYTTRVGDGPFPTELMDETAEAIREAGREYGRTTGRARRVGWLDLPAVKYSAALNGITYLRDRRRAGGRVPHEPDRSSPRPSRLQGATRLGDRHNGVQDARGSARGRAGLRRVHRERGRGPTLHDQRRTGAGAGDNREDRDLGPCG